MPWDIELRLVHAAIVLAEELHFGRAAQQLHITQSTLSRRIAELEVKTGFQVFNRNRKHVELTDSGRIYVQEARAILLHSERAVHLGRAALDTSDCILTVGHSPYADSRLVSILLAIRLPLYPNLKLHLQTEFALELVHSLVAAEIDVALITRPPTTDELTLVSVSKAPLYVALPASHPAAQKDAVSLKDFAVDSWIIFARRAHPLAYNAIMETAQLERVTPREIHHIVTAEEALHLVKENVGITFLTKATAVRQAGSTIVFRPLSEESLILETFLALRANDQSRMVNEYARAFLKRLRDLEAVALVHAG